MSEIRFFIFFLRKQVNVVAIYNTGNKVRGIILELKITNSSCQVINPYLFFYLSACVEYNWGSRDKQDCHTSVCSLVLCLVTTKIWSDGHQSPRRVAALGSWTNLCYSSQANQCYSSILFRRQQESERERERERKERTHAGERVHERVLWLLLLYVFFLHLGLPFANWAQPGVLFVLPEVFTLVLRPPFDLPCLLATTILDSFSLFYLPNRTKHVNMRALIDKCYLRLCVLCVLCAKPLQACLILCDPMDCRPPVSSPWDSPNKNTGVGCHFLLQGIFPTWGSNLCLLRVLHWQGGALPLAPLVKNWIKSPRNECIERRKGLGLSLES